MGTQVNVKTLKAGDRVKVTYAYPSLDFQVGDILTVNEDHMFFNERNGLTTRHRADTYTVSEFEAYEPTFCFGDGYMPDDIEEGDYLQVRGVFQGLPGYTPMFTEGDIHYVMRDEKGRLYIEDHKGVKHLSTSTRFKLYQKGEPMFDVGLANSLADLWEDLIDDESYQCDCEMCSPSDDRTEPTSVADVADLFSKSTPSVGYQDAVYQSKYAYPDNNPKTVMGTAKPGFHYIPPVAILHLGLAMKDGKEKYGLMNWRQKNVSSSVYYDAAIRHLMAWWDGENEARDSGVHHLAHVMACMAILIDARTTYTLNDDRPYPGDFGGTVYDLTNNI